jgi:hypothetical protein
MMAGIFDALKSLFGPAPADGSYQVSYANQGRCGYVYYRSRECDLDMYFEFGGGDVVASINVPSPTEWTSKTGLPLERRLAILNNIGKQVVRDQTTMGRGAYEIEDGWIVIKN